MLKGRVNGPKIGRLYTLFDEDLLDASWIVRSVAVDRIVVVENGCSKVVVVKDGGG